MAVCIKKTYKEHFPSLRLIGKRYTDNDRAGESFGHKWGEWFQNGWFDKLEQSGPLPENDDGYLGVMRVDGGIFEYWIGMFFPENTPVPEGFEHTDTASFNGTTCWLYGNESSGELYGMEAYNMVIDEAKNHGFVRRKDGWCFERYNCPRFTTPDDEGNVILDYCVETV